LAGCPEVPGGGEEMLSVSKRGLLGAQHRGLG
jgi:hypothetical protein